MSFKFFEMRFLERYWKQIYLDYVSSIFRFSNYYFLTLQPVFPDFAISIFWLSFSPNVKLRDTCLEFEDKVSFRNCMHFNSLKNLFDMLTLLINMITLLCNKIRSVRRAPLTSIFTTIYAISVNIVYKCIHVAVIVKLKQ